MWLSRGRLARVVSYEYLVSGTAKYVLFTVTEIYIGTTAAVLVALALK